MLLQVSVLIIQHHLHWYFSITITIDHFDRHHYYQFHLNHHFYHLHPYSSIGLIAREVKSAHSRNIHCICLPKPSRHVAIDIGIDIDDDDDDDNYSYSYADDDNE
jgi:hypothetical protein